MAVELVAVDRSRKCLEVDRGLARDLDGEGAGGGRRRGIEDDSCSVRLGQLGEWVVYLLRKGDLERMFIKQ